MDSCWEREMVDAVTVSGGGSDGENLGEARTHYLKEACC